MAKPLFSRALVLRQGSISCSATVRISSRNTSTSALYGIAALSNRHETQYFSRLSSLPLMEHSPTLKLIHTSEVAAGAASALPGSSSTEDRKVDAGAFEQTTLADVQEPNEGLDKEALLVGQRVLANYRRELRNCNRKIVELQKTVAELQEDAESASVDADSGEPLHNSDTQLDGWSRAGKEFRWGIGYPLFFLVSAAFGGLLYDRLREWTAQRKVVQEVQSRSESLVADGSQTPSQAQRTVDQILDSIRDGSQSPESEAFKRHLDAMRSTSPPEKSTASWSELLWKKQ